MWEGVLKLGKITLLLRELVLLVHRSGVGAAVVADAQVLCRTLWPESGTSTYLLVLCTRQVTESFLLPL